MKKLVVCASATLSVLLGAASGLTAPPVVQCVGGCIRSYDDNPTGTSGDCELGVRRVECMGSSNGTCDLMGGSCALNNNCIFKITFQYTSCCDDNQLEIRCHDTDCDMGALFSCPDDATTTCGSTVWADFPSPCVTCITGTAQCDDQKLCCAWVENANTGVKIESTGRCSACP